MSAGEGHPQAEGPRPASVVDALRAMSRLMAEGALGARMGEQEVRALQAGDAGNDRLRETTTLGLLAATMESVSGLAATLAYLIVEMDALRQQQAEILKRLGPRIILPGGGHG